MPPTRSTLRSALLLPLLAACASDGGLSLEERTEALYNTPIPAGVLTPDRVETRLGTLEFFDGFPSKETTRLVQDNLLFQRGTKAFLDAIPMASIEALRRGHVDNGVTECWQVAIADRLMDSDPLFLTGNTDTVYCSTFLNLEEDGPTVVEIPAGCGPGTVNDAFFRFVTDMGAPGPDRGQGGKYLILPPEYDGEVPDGYFVSQSPSFTNWLILRGFLVDGKPDAAVAMFRDGLKVYPLSQAASPPSMQFVSLSGMEMNTIHANDFHFYEEIADVVQREHLGFIDPELRGLLASIGIQKGKPFAPDARTEATLVEAVAVGNASARSLDFATPMEEAFYYPNSAWKAGFIGGDYRWLIDGGDGGRYLDARTYFFYCATVNTPAMALKMVGKGSQYAMANRDANGEYLNGAKTYRLNIPADPPAKDFWSVVVYDPQTRSQLQTGQPFPSKNSQKANLVENPDGSVDLYFGPTPPPGKESNWIETVPGKGWFALLRLYGPGESWFDKTWQPGEFVPESW